MRSWSWLEVLLKAQGLLPDASIIEGYDVNLFSQHSFPASCISGCALVGRAYHLRFKNKIFSGWMPERSESSWLPWASSCTCVMGMSLPLEVPLIPQHLYTTCSSVSDNPCSPKRSYLPTAARSRLLAPERGTGLKVVDGRWSVVWINVRDPVYFLGYGIPYIYEKRILFSSWSLSTSPELPQRKLLLAKAVNRLCTSPSRQIYAKRTHYIAIPTWSYSLNSLKGVT